MLQGDRQTPGRAWRRADLAGPPPMAAIDHLWNSLGTVPLLWLVVTLAAYAAGDALQRVCRGSDFVVRC